MDQIFQPLVHICEYPIEKGDVRRIRNRKVAFAILILCEDNVRPDANFSVNPLHNHVVCMVIQKTGEGVVAVLALA
ncbi:MAG: hypothetical protein ACKVUS_08935 [Saprospiraceae bacterium]